METHIWLGFTWRLIFGWIETHIWLVDLLELINGSIHQHGISTDLMFYFKAGQVCGGQTTKCKQLASFPRPKGVSSALLLHMFSH